MNVLFLLFNLLVVLVTLTSGFNSKSFMNELSSKERTCDTTVKSCKKVGKLCETCDHLVVCINNGEGDYRKLHSEDCLNDKKCVIDACTTDPNPICDGTACLPFICTSTGIYPDPFDCTKYHICIVEHSGATTTITQQQVNCGERFSYNMKTTFCDIPFTGACDGYPVPLCATAGVSEALKENPTIYYVCEQYNSTVTTLYPYLYICPHGEPYQNYSCGNNQQFGNKKDLLLQ